MNKKNSHSFNKGGNTRFWKGKEVNEYDKNQKMSVEHKDEVLNNMERIYRFFVKKYDISSVRILDIGCGPGTLSLQLLDSIGDCKIIGVDSSKQMIELSKNRLENYIPGRYSSYISDFNTENFWIPKIDKKYDFIVSSLALHYLSDERREAFFKEIYDHLKENGVFIGCIGNLSNVPVIREMEQIFKAEYAYKNKIQQVNDFGGLGSLVSLDDSENFDTFLTKSKNRQKEMNINWRSPKDYLMALKNAGFEKSEIVWHKWVKSIYVAIKRS